MSHRIPSFSRSCARILHGHYDQLPEPIVGVPNCVTSRAYEERICDAAFAKASSVSRELVLSDDDC